MSETFRTLIARNRRNSLILVGAFMVLFVVTGLLIGYFIGGSSSSSSRTYTTYTTRTSPNQLEATPKPPRVSTPANDAARWASAVTVAVIAGLVAFVITLFTYFGGSSMLMSMSNAREIQKSDDPQLFNVVEELSLAGGMPMPRIYLIDDTAMNAFATGRDPKHSAVAITVGLREKLTRDELQGVIGHELSHIRHSDVLFATLVAVLVGTLVMLCDLFMRSLWWGGGSSRSRDDDRDNKSNPLQIVLMVLAVVLAILAPILARIIQMAISRQREYLADAGSVELTRNPDGLASALAKLGGDTEKLEAANRATAPLYIVNPILKAADDATDADASVFDTHPPINERIRRLKALTGAVPQ